MTVDPFVVQLIYRSAAATPFSERELTDLLQRARDSNAQSGLTGLLLYENGSFLQVLEGEREPLLATYERILRDPRHQQIIKLLERELDQRRFGDWQMGFVSVTRLGLAIPGYSEFLRFRGEVGASGDQAFKVLSQFREGRFRGKVEG